MDDEFWVVGFVLLNKENTSKKTHIKRLAYIKSSERDGRMALDQGKRKEIKFVVFFLLREKTNKEQMWINVLRSHVIHFFYPYLFKSHSILIFPSIRCDFSVASHTLCFFYEFSVRMISVVFKSTSNCTLLLVDRLQSFSI